MGLLGLQTENKTTIFASQSGKRIGDALKIKYIQATTKLYITTTKYHVLYSFATVVISGGAEISDDNHPSTPRLKSSPWRARVARAPKAQAVARGDLLGNLLKIHQGLWYDP